MSADHSPTPAPQPTRPRHQPEGLRVFLSDNMQRAFWITLAAEGFDGPLHRVIRNHLTNAKRADNARREAALERL